MSRRYVSGVASRGAFKQIDGRWYKAEDMDPQSQWGWPCKGANGWTAPATTLAEAREEAAR